ncbi:hypothetical protein DESHY_10087 [Desulforamulus hydrothermalis Lam5 = DSM 18033]|uniref:Uncharacterized protein n=1 Tax=Desulforamulus hydrothermalis Lam5 = DSM 18033 TaxID=1121428 RepID=K8DWT8_9FIRM|nr:hypothetical protein DESHY_10087 [Desulforamulus hydrothermalis Lam5 = DSM 18033]
MSKKQPSVSLNHPLFLKITVIPNYSCIFSVLSRYCPYKQHESPNPVTRG